MLKKSLLIVAVAPFAAAQSVDIDFSGLAHGEIITNQFDGLGVSISALNPNRSFDIAAIFDTETTGGPDPDLQGPPWSGGNLATSPTTEVLGGALIIAEDDTDSNGDGLLDVPNDEGSRPAGQLNFELMFVATALGFDVIDIEGVVQEGSSIDFRLNGMNVLSVDFDDFTTMGSAYFDASIQFGNNSANRISPIEVAGGFDAYTINVGGSGAFDGFVIVPAPATSLLLLGACGFAGRSRR